MEISNAFLSTIAMIRYTERKDGLQATNTMEEFLDVNFQVHLGGLGQRGASCKARQIH